MSFGTTVSCHNLQNEMLENFVDIFSKLSYKIVWKFDCNKLLRKLDNAFISKWFPQQGVFGKIKNHYFAIGNPFMTHAALLIISFVQLIRISSCLFIKADFRVPKKLFITQFQSWEFLLYPSRLLEFNDWSR